MNRSWMMILPIALARPTLPFADASGSLADTSFVYKRPPTTLRTILRILYIRTILRILHIRTTLSQQADYQTQTALKLAAWNCETLFQSWTKSFSLSSPQQPRLTHQLPLSAEVQIRKFFSTQRIHPMPQMQYTCKEDPMVHKKWSCFPQRMNLPHGQNLHWK
eukprot:Gregarina_sp_Poly_1__9288@NODE_575_length_7472_cov_59_507225_g449_i0_p5_GENE_NODE_575_length_7472_cov_59_507225_g449_i0NODE_575_length_7472_cov_59_507225_g449_i0_p5_ORF_typecomplete_len163_score17_17PEX2N/PF09263_10/0_12BORA_N/PF15280_6/3_9e02BORA_N/PF15280_6/0_34_NODE_575_length_7472_cov_59_507225_g449_i043531